MPSNNVGLTKRNETGLSVENMGNKLEISGRKKVQVMVYLKGLKISNVH
jgi:hypothetical protein